MISLRSLLAALLAISITHSSPAAAVTEDAALAVLSSGADLHQSAVACQQLGVVGTAKSVPALAALLDKEHLSAYARCGLENIEDPSAGKALRDALPGLKGHDLSGVVNSLGVRRDAAAVPALQTLALDPQSGVQSEALASLGMIATPAAAKTLMETLRSGPAELRVPAAHAAFTAASHLAKNGDTPAAQNLLVQVLRTFPKGQLADTAKRLSARLASQAVPAGS